MPTRRVQFGVRTVGGPCRFYLLVQSKDRLCLMVRRGPRGAGHLPVMVMVRPTPRSGGVCTLDLAVVIPYFLRFSSPPPPPSGSPENWSRRYREHHENMRNVAQIRMVRFAFNFGFCGPVRDKHLKAILLFSGLVATAQ